MICYFVANIKINDPGEYEKYLEHVDEIFSKYHGEYLAVDTNPGILEGKWEYSKCVLIKFPGKQAFDDWYYSEDYQKILHFRLNSAICDSILLEGLD